MYAHSKFVAPLVQPGSSDDYINKQAVEDNVNKFDQPEDPFEAMDPAKQRQIIRNAFSVVILSPRKDLKGNAQQYQAIADLPGNAELGDIFDRVMSSRSYHNFHNVEGKAKDPTDLEGQHGMMGMEGGRPTYEKQLRTLHEYISTTKGVSDAQAWRETKDTLSRMYKEMEPYAEQAIEAEGGEINVMRMRLKVIEMANAWLESIIGGPREWQEPGQLMGTPDRTPGSVPTDLPGIPVESKTAAGSGADQNEQQRYSGVVYGHLESISNITHDHLEMMRQYAMKDHQRGQRQRFHIPCWLRSAEHYWYRP